MTEEEAAVIIAGIYSGDVDVGEIQPVIDTLKEVEVMTEEEAAVIIAGIYSGDVDAIDVASIFTDPAAWLADSESFAARRIRGEEDE